MRDLSPSFAARLDSGVTTLCACWRVVRRDGAVFGFTDHDRDLDVAGVTHAALSGFEGSAFESGLGLAVGGGEVSGALNAAALVESDLVAGVWDGARVEIRRVDWTSPQDHLLIDVAVIGEVRRTENSFVAELRSLAHELDQEQGRLYQASCDAELGDARCRFAFAGAPFVVDVTLDAGTTAMELRASLVGVEEGFFSGGRAEILDGVAAGARVGLSDHRSEGDAHRLKTWTPLGTAPAPGDRARLWAGCDKSFETCRRKFANGVNFRGFPHMPGLDVVMSYPRAGATMDGGSLFK